MLLPTYVTREPSRRGYRYTDTRTLRYTADTETLKLRTRRSIFLFDWSTAEGRHAKMQFRQRGAEEQLTAHKNQIQLQIQILVAPQSEINFSTISSRLFLFRIFSWHARWHAKLLKPNKNKKKEKTKQTLHEKILKKIKRRRSSSTFNYFLKGRLRGAKRFPQLAVTGGDEDPHSWWSN